MSGDSYKIKRDGEFVDITELTLAHLKEEIKHRDLSSVGNKTELRERLRDVVFTLIYIYKMKLIFLIFFYNNKVSKKTTTNGR